MRKREDTMFDEYINPEKNKVELLGIDRIKKFNQQAVSVIDKKIETVQHELLNLHNMLMEHGDLLEEIQS